MAGQVVTAHATVKVEQGQVRLLSLSLQPPPSGTPGPTDPTLALRQAEEVARAAQERRMEEEYRDRRHNAVADEYLDLDPDALYVWYTPKKMSCLYCGMLTNYYTGRDEIGDFVNRTKGDGRCKDLFHYPVASYPCDMIGGLIPQTVEASGWRYDQVHNLSEIIEQSRREQHIRWEAEGEPE